MIQMMESAVRSPMSPKQQQHLVQLIKSDQLFHVDCPLYPSQVSTIICVFEILLLIFC